MAGTGKKGYTGPALYGGTYNISNGIIQSGAGATNSGVANRNGAITTSNSSNNYSSGVSELANNVASKISNIISGVVGNKSSPNYDQYVSQIGDMFNGLEDTIKTSQSDYADMVRQILENQNENTAKSQAFAREQMDYQRESDQAAMAWSAQEAQKNRDWQEKLSNTAHQREVQDLLAAGLNPILSANAGAYTGSGATGQGFSSSGAMGQVDSSGSGALAGLFSTITNTAMQASIAKMYTDAERYSADQSYAASKLASETSLYNNNNTVNASKAINKMNAEYDIQKANINAAASRYLGDSSVAAANASAGGMIGAANINSEASRYVADTNKLASDYRADRDYAARIYGSDSNILTNPVGTATKWIEQATGINVPEATKKIFKQIETPSYYDVNGAS